MQAHNVDYIKSNGGAVSNKAVGTALIALAPCVAVIGGTLTAATAIGSAPVSGPVATLGGAVVGWGASKLSSLYNSDID